MEPHRHDRANGWRTAFRAGARRSAASRLPLLLLSSIFCIACTAATTAKTPPNTVTLMNITDATPTTKFGAVGDGKTDDTAKLQEALTYCSNNNLICEIPTGTKHLVTAPLFFWGGGSLVSSGGGGIVFKMNQEVALFNLGISSKAKVGAATSNLRDPFRGNINGVTFTVMQGAPPTGGRLMYFWRTDGARIEGNTFNVDRLKYTAMSSGNNSDWVASGANCIRKNLTITNNVVNAAASADGAEGIAVDSFDTVTISNNVINDVGDDPIGIHLSKNIKVLRNTMRSVDGRLFVSNSNNVEIGYNTISRGPSLIDKRFYKGIALIYIGFENYDITNPQSALLYPVPENINVHDNELSYPAGAIDGGAAIYIYSPRKVTVANNTISNDSNSSKDPHYGVYVTPAEIPGWKDPTGIDTMKNPQGVTVARVHDGEISGNVNKGKYPLPIVMTGNCIYYTGGLKFTNNTGAAAGTKGTGAPGEQIYCVGTKVTAANNKASVATQ